MGFSECHGGLAPDHWLWGGVDFEGTLRTGKAQSALGTRGQRLGFNGTSALRSQDRGKAPHLCFLLPSGFLPSGESDTFNTAQQLPTFSFPWQTFSMFEDSHRQEKSFLVPRHSPHPCRQFPHPAYGPRISCLPTLAGWPGEPWSIIVWPVACGCDLCCLLSLHVHMAPQNLRAEEAYRTQ